eukprot:7222788-Alexandrium_andersonii.AAC.1
MKAGGRQPSAESRPWRGPLGPLAMAQTAASPSRASATDPIFSSLRSIRSPSRSLPSIDSVRS